VSTPAHNWVIVCPFANVQVTVHPVLVPAPVLVTVTAAWKPPDHELVIAYTAEHPPPGGGVVVGGTVGGVVGGRVVGGTVVGGTVVGGTVVGGTVVGGMVGGVVLTRSA